MWLLRKPRKLLLIVLIGAILWTVISYLLSKLHGNTNDAKNSHQLMDKNVDLFQYDDSFPETVAGKVASEQIEFVDIYGSNVVKSKLDEAVNREEKKNLIKHKYLKQDIEDVNVIDQKMDEQIDDDFDAVHTSANIKRKRPTVLLPSATFWTSFQNNEESNSHTSLIPLNAQFLPKNEKRSKHSSNFYNYGHNETVSRTLSLHRSLPDFRDRLCLNVGYSKNLPDVSVIIAFYNEAWTTLLRTVHSVLDRSQPHLIKEIILIDDFSEHEHLQQQLEDYLALLPKVNLKRTSSRVGVIAARQYGASLATGAVLIFLDAHCECTVGWLEPMLERIQDDMTHVVTPVMDIIDDKTFEYKSFDVKSINIGGFDWNLQFIWIGVPERSRKLQKSDIDFIGSPTMPGGMFAISRKFFSKLGGFDTGMDMWGAENLEMSFKIWMCGGSLETAPCSHVGHLFRQGTTYKLGEGNPHKNYFRLAEVWLDDYKELFYQRVGKAVDLSEDVVKRKMLRKNLQCQNFSWYLENIYPELFIPSHSVAAGEIRNKESADGASFQGCLDAATGSVNSVVKIWPCHNQGGNQLWMLSKAGEIRRDDGCMDYSGAKVVILSCHGQRGNQAWEYRPDNTIRHINSKLCMGLSPDGGSLAMSKCAGRNDQRWYWKRTSNQNKSEDDNKPGDNNKPRADNKSADGNKREDDDKPEDDNKLLQEIAMDNY